LGQDQARQTCHRQGQKDRCKSRLHIHLSRVDCLSTEWTLHYRFLTRVDPGRMNRGHWPGLQKVYPAEANGCEFVTFSRSVTP
jgi:hypothetical protein